MGFIESIKGSLSQDPPPLEEAIVNIGKEIRDDVMAGNFEEAQSLLEENLQLLEKGEFESAVMDDNGRYAGYDKSWPAPEEEANQLVNFVFLELLELVVKDLETVESRLEPPIVIQDSVKNEEITLENGLEGEIRKLEEFLKSYTKQEVEKVPRKKFKRFIRSGYEHAFNIRAALGTASAQGAKDAVNAEKYRTKRHGARASEGKYQENMGVLITVKMAERHLEFIQKLAEWEHNKYGLELDPQEKEKIKQVKKWLEERYKIIKELDDIIHPFVVDNGAESGITKDEAFKNPKESLKRLSKADRMLDELHKLENKEDSKLKKLDSMLP